MSIVCILLYSPMLEQNISLSHNTQTHIFQIDRCPTWLPHHNINTRIMMHFLPAVVWQPHLHNAFRFDSLCLKRTEISVGYNHICIYIYGSTLDSSQQKVVLSRRSPI